MWSKTPSSQPPAPVPAAAPPSPAPAPKAPPAPTGTIIGESMKIKGNLISREELQFNGELEGQLQTDARVTVGPSAKVNASIKAREVVVSGSVHGNIEAEQRVVISKGAHLEGDVKTAGIVIEDGAYFKGGIDITMPAGAATGTKAAKAEA
jgi:cytoskeletal protein CcmA (bactofilin family)